MWSQGLNFIMVWSDCRLSFVLQVVTLSFSEDLWQQTIFNRFSPPLLSMWDHFSLFRPVIVHEKNNNIILFNPLEEDQWLENSMKNTISMKKIHECFGIIEHLYNYRPLGANKLVRWTHLFIISVPSHPSCPSGDGAALFMCPCQQL